MLKKADRVREDIGDELNLLRVWIFGWSGFTREAEEFMKEQAVMWSSKLELNGLLEYTGLRHLPELGNSY